MYRRTENMRYYKHLYLTEGLEKKKEKIIRKLEAGKLQPGVHVITLAVSERNQLEIYPTIQFKQPAFPEQELFVVGITKCIEGRKICDTISICT